MFALTDQPIDGAALAARLQSPDTGAFCVFEGRVRNHHLGQPVTQLEYEAFDELARREGEAIVAETAAIFPGARVECVHRTGRLEIGDVAVWIGVASAHRQAAFAACRHVIEEIKRRLPIWKKEHHPGGAAEWVNCASGPAEGARRDDYHARQVALPEVGARGQAALAAARVAVVGVGGLGCPAALYLATAGVGRLTLLDDGLIERANLHRQVLFTAAEVGAAKVGAAAARLREHNDAVSVETHAVRVRPDNARALLAGHDVVLDCTDRLATRFLVHDVCQELRLPLVQAAVHRFEGTLDVFVPGVAGCLHCAYGDADPDRLEAESCAGGPVFAPAVAMLGLMQAAEALKLILGLAGSSDQNTTLLNLLDNSTTAIARTARSDCRFCGGPAATRRTPVPGESVMIGAVELPRLGEVRIVDLREWARPAGDRSGGELDELRKLPADRPIVLRCASGVRSAALARLLRAAGRRAYALEPGDGAG